MEAYIKYIMAMQTVVFFVGVLILGVLMVIYIKDTKEYDTEKEYNKKKEEHKEAMKVTVELMRAEVAKLYPGDAWKNKVKSMSDAQIIAIYKRQVLR